MRQALQVQITAFASGRRYRQATIERWLALDDADGAAVLGIAGELRLGENQLRDLWQWAEEIAAREGDSLAEVLNRPAVVGALRQPVGRQDQLKLVKAALRRLRFPMLSTTEDRLRVLLRELKLPPSIRVDLPEFLEGDGVRIELRASSASALRQAATALLVAADSATCAELFHLLDEAP